MLVPIRITSRIKTGVTRMYIFKHTHEDATMSCFNPKTKAETEAVRKRPESVDHFKRGLTPETHQIVLEKPGQPALDLSHYLIWQIGQVTQKSIANTDVT